MVGSLRKTSVGSKCQDFWGDTECYVLATGLNWCCVEHPTYRVPVTPYHTQTGHRRSADPERLPPLSCGGVCPCGPCLSFPHKGSHRIFFSLPPVDFLSEQYKWHLSRTLVLWTETEFIYCSEADCIITEVLQIHVIHKQIINSSLSTYLFSLAISLPPSLLIFLTSSLSLSICSLSLSLTNQPYLTPPSPTKPHVAADSTSLSSHRFMQISSWIWMAWVTSVITTVV